MPGQTIITTSHPFVKAVAAALRERCGVEPGHRILVAVSGGADSIALLRALHVLAGQRHWRLNLHVAHINHKLRDEADAEEKYVENLAAALGVAFHKSALNVKGLPGNLEANARRHRYAALARIAEAVDADAIAVAHHADDQLETMLMRLIRGASVEGLAGMAWVRNLQDTRARLIRPMMGVDRAAVVKFLVDSKLTWCEDHTNADLSRWRARLRADVLPVLREMRQTSAEKAVQAGDDLRQAAGLIRKRIMHVFESQVRPMQGSRRYSMIRRTAGRLPQVILTGLLRHVAVSLGSRIDGLDHATLNQIARVIRDKKGELRTFELSGGVCIRVEDETVVWMRYDRGHEADDQR